MIQSSFSSRIKGARLKPAQNLLKMPQDYPVGNPRVEEFDKWRQRQRNKVPLFHLFAFLPPFEVVDWPRSLCGHPPSKSIHPWSRSRGTAQSPFGHMTDRPSLSSRSQTSTQNPKCRMTYFVSLPTLGQPLTRCPSKHPGFPALTVLVVRSLTSPCLLVRIDKAG